MTKPKQIGYKSPPTAHQWQPGKSGNPTGKKKLKKPVQSLPELLAAVLYEPTLMTISGKKQKMSLAEALAKKLAHNIVNAPIKPQVEALKKLVEMGVLDIQNTTCEEECADDPFTEEHRRLLEITQSAMAGFDDDEEGYEYEENCDDNDL